MSKKIRFLMIEAGSELEMGIPPNIAILVSSLKKNNVDVKVFSTNLYVSGKITGDKIRVNTLQVPPTSSDHLTGYVKNITQVVDDLRKVAIDYQPDIVGLSVTEPLWELGSRLLLSIKDKTRYIIVGGALAILCPEKIICKDFVDAVCVGEGEKAIAKFCYAVSRKKTFEGIENIWFKENGEVVKNGFSTLSNINNVPFQDWSEWGIPPRAMKAMAGDVKLTALAELSRGCPFKCSYCANSYLNEKFRGHYREKRVENFVNEICYLKSKYGLSFVYISDETILNISSDRFNDFINMYGKLSIPFWCETRPESISYEKILSLKSVGLKSVNIGVEGGNYNFRKKILNRRYKDDMVIDSVSHCNRAGVRINANIIIGFPGETREHIFESIELMRESKPSSIMIHLFQPYVKTPLRKLCIEKGIIGDDFLCGDYRMDAIGTEHLSSKELLGLQRTFNLYVDIGKDRWDEIEAAEEFSPKGNKIFVKLAKEYQKKKFGRTSF